MTRNPNLDALRGLMLVLMTLTHLPTAAAQWASQPFGYVSDAEGFVFLSSYLVGRIYSQDAQANIHQIAAPLWHRTRKIYLYHIATLALVFTVGALIAIYMKRPMLANLLGYYLEHPGLAAIQGVFLIYRPPLLDILPMYIVFMLITPLVLHRSARKGWRLIFAWSGLIWLGAQFGLGRWLYTALNSLSLLHLPPWQHLGAFNLFAWQLLWICGIWLGQCHRRRATPATPIPGTLKLAIVLLVCSFAFARYRFGGYPAQSPSWALKAISKWDLGPLRLLDFAALAMFSTCYGTAIARHFPSGGLQLLGRSSLTVFCAHIIACILVLGLVRNDGVPLTPTVQILAVGFSFALMYGVALNEQRSAISSSAPWRFGAITYMALDRLRRWH